MKSETTVALAKILLKQQDDQKKHERLILKIEDEYINDISRKIEQYGGQRFAFTINGVNKYTKIFTEGESRTTKEIFYLTYVGIIRKNTKLQKDSQFKSKDSAVENYLIEASSLFESNSCLIDDLRETHFIPRLVPLGNYQDGKPSWSIRGLFMHEVPEFMRTNICFFRDRGKDMNLFLGNDEFDKFLNSRLPMEMEAIKKLNIWK